MTVPCHTANGGSSIRLNKFAIPNSLVRTTHEQYIACESGALLIMRDQGSMTSLSRYQRAAQAESSAFLSTDAKPTSS